MKIIVLFFVLFLLSSCARLDNNLYNLSDEITEYKRDAYTGTQDFILDSSYTIPSALINEFTLSSKGQNEDNGTTIYATYIGDIKKIATDTVIMYCHGNKWHMDFYWQRAKLLANIGSKNRFGVMMVDYRGYGLSKGTPTENGLYDDVDAALTWLKQQGLGNNRLVIYGFSLGSAAATKLSAEPRSMIPSKLILESPFASAAAMVQEATVLDMPGSFFTNLKINNAEEIKGVTQPFMWIHGINDQFLSIKTQGEVVYKNYHGVYSEAHRVAGADHGEVPLKFGFTYYKNALLDFIRR